MDASLLARVDIALLIRNMGGNEKVIPKLFELFWKTAAHCSAKLDSALAAKDLTAWHAAAHELRGAALSITARRIAALCDEAEQFAQLKQKEGATLLYHLNKEIAILREMLPEMKG
jgi:HPt (histidine-containing phosphotransfer) domain-containing protein